MQVVNWFLNLFLAIRHQLLSLLMFVYRAKFSILTALVVILMSILYTIYRTHHWLVTWFHLPDAVAWPTAAFVEALVVASAAMVFISLREDYRAELRNTDTDRSKRGVKISIGALIVSFGSLTAVAWADAYKLTKEYAPSALMAFIQIAQMLFIVVYIVHADLDSREQLRNAFREEQEAETKRKEAEANEAKQKDEQERIDAERRREEEARRKARQCPYCYNDIDPNNRRRHIASCVMNPTLYPVEEEV